MKKKKKKKDIEETKEDITDSMDAMLLVAMVDQVWVIYDEDGNNELDYKEAKNFIIDYMEIMGSNREFDERIFGKAFREYDEDCSGTIDRKEMIGFINKLNEEMIDNDDINFNCETRK